MIEISFTSFNLSEGVFWIFCAAVSIFATRFKIAPPPLWRLLALDFLLFGVTDFIEAYYPVSFFDSGGEWLFALKIICVLGFFACLAWYLVSRIKNHLNKKYIFQMYFVERGMNPARRPKGAPLWNPRGAPRGKAPRYCTQ